MKDILTAPFMTEMIRTTANMYAHGWDERNGGNISLLLDEAEVSDYVNLNAVIRTIPTGFEAPALDGKYFLVTGTGKYFKNVQYAPDVNLGLMRLRDKGAALRGADGVRYLYYDADGEKVVYESYDTTVRDMPGFTLLEEAGCPAVLAEQCFVTNEADAAAFAGEDGCKAAARLYYEAITC